MSTNGTSGRGGLTQSKSDPPTPTPKQAAFVDAYLACGTAAAAYRIAYDAENMLAQTIRNAASKLLRHPAVATMLAARRAETQVAVDAAIAAARTGALVNVGQLQHIAGLDPEAHLKELPSVVRSAERLLEIAEVIPKGGVVVDARSVTVNFGAHDERLAGVSVEELTAIIDRLRAGDGVVVETTAMEEDARAPTEEPAV